MSLTQIPILRYCHKNLVCTLSYQLLISVAFPAFASPRLDRNTKIESSKEAPHYQSALIKLTYFMLARQSVRPVSLDSTSGSAAGFQDGDRVSSIFEESSRDESADAGADDDDV